MNICYIEWCFANICMFSHLFLYEDRELGHTSLQAYLNKLDIFPRNTICGNIYVFFSYWFFLTVFESSETYPCLWAYNKPNFFFLLIGENSMSNHSFLLQLMPLKVFLLIKKLSSIIKLIISTISIRNYFSQVTMNQVITLMQICKGLKHSSLVVTT